ncbi:MAG: hypothetical protein NTV51_08915 [Verrucomicrobia bacterium]|nr:hypothetical protein [Verrucomicrobiota bacterium]
MAIVPLTLTISLCLVFTFIIFFVREHARGRLSSAERDSLMPLADETPILALARHGRAHLHHDGDDQACGCRDGSRPPCAGCAKRHEHA